MKSIKIKLLLTIVTFALVSYIVAGIQPIYPNCSLSSEEKLTTPVTLYVSSTIKHKFGQDEVRKVIDQWFETSNQILDNSCIPMRRELRAIEYISDINELWFQSVSAAKTLLGLSLSKSENQHYLDNSTDFYAVVLETYRSSVNSSTCGIADETNFFVIGFDCHATTFEHELGHLNGASHDHIQIERTFGSKHNFAQATYPRPKPYAFASFCGGKGTIMSYAQEIIPAYSSPKIHFQGDTCGNEFEADNARVLTEFALKHMQNN